RSRSFRGAANGADAASRSPGRCLPRHARPTRSFLPGTGGARGCQCRLLCAKQTRFHGARLQVIARRQSERLPLPQQIWLCAASHHDSKSFVEQAPRLPETVLFGDLAYPTPEIKAQLAAQQTRLMAPQKKPKGSDLSPEEQYYNRLVRGLRQPIESLFPWLEEKTGIQTAIQVHSNDGLL